MSSDPVINSALLRMCAQTQTAAPTHDDVTAASTRGGVSSSGGSDGVREGVILAPDVPSPPPVQAASPTPAARTPDDYAWLRNALAAVEAPERRVKTLLERAEQSARSGDEIVAALDELSDLVEDINWATEFALMHGPRRIVRLLQTSPHAAASAPVRAAVAMVMAHSAQLSDALQSRYAEAQWCDVLLPCLRAENDDACVAALLHACSCLCRGHAANTVAFVQQGGLDVLATLLRRRLPRAEGGGEQQAQDGGDDGQAAAGAAAVRRKVVVRALFFLRYFAEAGVSSEALIELACQHAQSSEDASVQSAAAAALLQLLRKSPAAVRATMRRVMHARLRAWQTLRDAHGSTSGGDATCVVSGDNDDDDDARMQLMVELDRAA